MKLRKNFLPRNFADWLSFLFIGLVIPLFYWFEMFVVVADFYPEWSFWYCWHFMLGTFAMVNIVGNLLATMFVDTSIFGAHLEVLKNNAHAFCTSCQLPIPPRCWHCDICNRCILKRDHHCTFAGYCIGQLNHRYFMMFLTSLFLACCYALYLNAFYILPRVDFNIFTVFQVLTPLMLMLLDGLNALKYILMMMLVLNVVGLGITGALSYFHWKLVLKGAVSFEHNRDIKQYNFGWQHNLVCVFGLRWYLTWISPFIESTMVFDGADWDVHKVLPKIKVI